MNVNISTSAINFAGGTPEAHPTVNKNRLKKYGNLYYLNDKTEFGLELYNPSWNVVLAKIWMNDKLISTSGLILDPNERVYLERYLDTNKKFKFKVFDVDNVKETEEARNRNGKVKIQFYQQQPTRIIDDSKIWRGGYIFNSPANTYGNNTTIYNTSVGMNATVESGRIDEGSTSSQKFVERRDEFYSHPFHTVEFQLLPTSLKPVSVKEIRNYCPECGYRLRKDSWKFCPNCGEEL